MMKQKRNMGTSSGIILNSLTDGIVVIDSEGKIRSWNAAMQRLFRIEKQEAIGKVLTEVFPQWRGNGLARAISDILTKKSLSEKEVRKIEHLKEDTLLTYQVRLSPLRDKRQRIKGVVIIVTDISEKVRLEKRLIQSERLASIGKLAAGVAHELNNPLDGVIRYTNLALELAEENSIFREYLLNAKDGLNRMVKIIRSLLEFSRQAATKPTRLINVQEAIEEAFSLLSPQLKNPFVEIVKNYQESLPLVLDGGLYIVFSNLIKNAYDAMPRGGTLRIATAVKDKFVEVKISDTGYGISDKIQHNIFEPFFSTKEIGKGTGLGLAICKEIVERCEGKIQVISKEGIGTTFILYLPIHREEKEEMK